jgi:NAD(P)-dependent dehydrogenase (short-subunit alcohol dehydrogenase family)
MAFVIDLSDQVVLITGGTKGIGHGVVEMLLAAGATVAFCAPDEDEYEAVTKAFQRQFPSAEGKVVGLSGDLRDRASLSALVATVIERFGRIDTLICNAADFGSHSPLSAVDPERYAQLLNNNVVNNFYLAREVLGHMAVQGSGSVIFMTSIVGFQSMPTNIPYSSSKAAITAMARSLAGEYAPLGIRVNCISPGLIKSEASRDIWEDPEFARRYCNEKIPMRRIGEPQDIAGACLYLASPLSSYVTGTTIPVDGGRLGIGVSAGSSEQVDKAAATK